MDPNFIQFVESLPEEQKAVVIGVMDEINQKESFRMMNAIVSKCFDSCVNNFRGTKLDDSEAKCLRICGEKYVKGAQRVMVRFGELNAAMQPPNPGTPSENK